MAWLSGGWGQRVAITVSNTNIDSNLTHFPVLLTLGTSVGTGTDDVSFIFDELTSDANRKKIALTKSDGTTQIYCEIDKWDDANEDAWLWVSKSDLVLSSSGTTTLYLYFDSTHADNTTWVGDIGDSQSFNVWDSNFISVHHMRDLTTSSIEDSTGNYDGTKKGAGEPVISTSGLVGDAQSYDGSDDGISLGDIEMGAYTELTVEGFVKATAGTTQRMISKDQAGVAGCFMLRAEDSGGEVSFLVRDKDASTWREGASATALSGAWQYLAGVVDIGGSPEVAVYVDGVVGWNISSMTSATLDDADDEVIAIGADSDPDGYAEVMDGLVDEVRISDVARSVDWIKACYYAQTDALVSWGSEELGTSIKLVMGVPIANIKTINGVAIADVKSVLGVSNVS